ncbi:MAG TPA: histidine phosphatase family protein [Solirubrobacteraceae bacterium]|nr:histidine phosphatase family protein [Solirubrobacteraceae bacterium]
MTDRSPGGIYLARHGRTAYNHEGRFQGQQEVPLDDLGREQAAELAERATSYGFAALWCSPLRRARETADAVAAATGLEPHEDARFMETDAGDWTNRTFVDVRGEAPELFDAFANADPDFAFPGGESFLQQEERVGAALDDVEAAGEMPTLVVCHGMVIRAALSVRIGRWLPYGQRVPNGAIVPLEPSEEELAAIGRAPAPEAS